MLDEVESAGRRKGCTRTGKAKKKDHIAGMIVRETCLLSWEVLYRAKAFFGHHLLNFGVPLTPSSLPFRFYIAFS